MNIFLSFHSKELNVADSITKHLLKTHVRAYGVDLLSTFGAENLHDIDRMYRMMGYPSYVIVILSNSYLKDGWFHAEVPALAALERRLGGDLIVVVRTEKIERASIPAQLRGRRIIDLTEANLQTGLTLLQRRCKAISRPQDREVFIVHGHDGIAKEQVRRFVKSIGLKPVILQDLPAADTRGILDKFERHADVKFAIAIVSPDDLGRAVLKASKSKHRARQNVILELGYFIGKLGMGHVAALLTGDVELPSDLHGVEFFKLDDQADWHAKLLRELKLPECSADKTVST